MPNHIYDISIWEEIAPTVRWPIDQLFRTIKTEISQDGTLQEFQKRTPVPWQLERVMEQRADAWTQRAYDICCSAYRNVGKTPSLTFDYAVWAYAIEPFIMSGNESEIRTDGSTGFIELLLCAVGSPPDRRTELKISQKECCLRVRSAVYKTWHVKLHHLTLELIEAATAMSRANEARLSRFSPNTPMQPQSGLPTERSLTVASPISATHAASPVLPQDDHASERVEESDDTRDEAEWEIVSSQKLASDWESIDIWFLSDDRIQIRVRHEDGKFDIGTWNYGDFGLADSRTGIPNRAWVFLRELAKQKGVIKTSSEDDPRWTKVEKRVQEIRKILREHFSMSSDPIPFVNGTGYQARFKISCRPSFHT